MRRFTGSLAACFLACAASAAAAAPGFEIGARATYWFPDLSAQFQTFDPAPEGTRFDAKDDLGVGDEKFLSGEGFVRFGRVHLRLGYTPVEFDGNNTLTRDIIFRGRTFSIAENVVSRLDVDMVDAEVQVDLFRPSLVAANFSLGVTAKIKYVDGHVELRSATLAERRDFRAPVPMLGLAAGVGLLRELVRVDARAGGVAYSGNHLFETDVFASVVPYPFLRIQAGYRLIDLKLDEDDLLVDLRLNGPYLGAQFSF
jgi:outer membrane protein